MIFQRRLLTPFVATESIGIHDSAESAYRLWSCLSRQFTPGSLTSGISSSDFLIDPLHAVQDRRGQFYVFAGFSAYQKFLALAPSKKKSQASILCYSDLDDPDAEIISLVWLLSSLEDGCLDRSSGLEQLRESLGSLIDKRVLESVCNTTRMSRSEFALRANVTASVLKAQGKKGSPSTKKRMGAKHYVLKELTQ